MNQSYRYLFGPVRSRRLGRSLGIDLVPSKVCTFDCPYCQVGATTSKVVERRDYVPVDGVMAEFDDWMAGGGQADHLTLAGAGEPTLHARLGEILAGLAARSAIPRVLLSNGSLFHLPEVRAAAAGATIVKGTLSAWDQESFRAAHRPHVSLDFETFLGGLTSMRAGFRGEFWLEVFLVAGLNDGLEAVKRIARLARVIRPDRIHLNTAVRPAWDTSVQPVAPARLAELAALFSPAGEAVASVAGRPAEAPERDEAGIENRLVGMVQRHPSTAADMAAALGLAADAADSIARRLEARGVLRVEPRGGERYYLAG